MASVEFLKQHSLVLARSKRKFCVTGFTISSNVKPTAIFAANFAIGYPVALDASADERLTRGFTSIT